MKNLKLTLIAGLLLTAQTTMAQTFRKQIVENGGTGKFKSEIVGDSTLERFTIYRPQQLKEVVKKAGKLPVILYANGACANNNVEIRYFLNEIASHGYVAAAIGPYDEADFYAHWTDVMRMMYPKKKDVVLANGTLVKRPSQDELKQMIEKQKAEREAAMKAAQQKGKKGKKGAAPVVPSQQTYPKMLLEVLEWLTDQNANPKSEYYHCLNLDEIAVMGQSCGGAQALAVAHDPRIKTCVILNSGIGDMEMMGANKDQLENLHTPMFYLIGGEGDIAFPNAGKDFVRLNHVPVVMINTIDEHEGTYYEEHGGSYAVAVTKWLDWQLKKQEGQSALFLDDEYIKMKYPDWTIERKNF
jgi:dienelactone hydrolase